MYEVLTRHTSHILTLGYLPEQHKQTPQICAFNTRTIVMLTVHRQIPCYRSHPYQSCPFINPFETADKGDDRSAKFMRNRFDEFGLKAYYI